MPAVLRNSVQFQFDTPFLSCTQNAATTATLSRDSISDCCYAWSMTKALSFNLLLQTGPEPRDLISPSSSSRLSKTGLSLTPLLQHAAVPMDSAPRHCYNATICCSANVLSLTTLLQPAVVPMDSASPHCCNMLQYQ